MSKKLKISTYSEDHGNFINLNDIVFFFAKHINIFIFNIILIGSISILYAQFIAEYQYTSTAKIMSTSSSGQSQIAGLASEFGISLPTNQSEPKWVYDDIIKMCLIHHFAFESFHSFFYSTYRISTSIF